MPHAVAASTGAHFDGTNTLLTYDVLVVDASIPGGSTYISSAVVVNPETDSADALHAAIADQLVVDVEGQAGVTLSTNQVVFPARAKGAGTG